MARRRVKKRHVAAGTIVGIIAGILAYTTITVTGGGGHSGITITFGGPHGTAERQVTVPQAALEQAKQTMLDDHDHARTENPPGVTPAQLDASREQQERLAASSALPNVTPDAAPQQRGCTTRLVQNYSSRRGVPPRIFVLHYTVSPNRPGWSDVLAVAGLFDRPAFQASSNYIVDAEGHCLYIVRESDKAWTQAAANPYAISVEVINTGHEPSYAGKAGLEKIALIVHDAAHRWHFPIQQGAVSGCLVTRPGIVDHHSLGACGGGHFDITPFSTAEVIRAAAALDASPPAKKTPCTARALQRRLGLTADGIVGPKTRAAIRKFQLAHHLKPTGYAGARVGALLKLEGCRL